MALALRFAEEGEFSGVALCVTFWDPNSRAYGSEGLGENNTLAVLVGQEVPVAATWIWLNTLMKHVEQRTRVSGLAAIHDLRDGRGRWSQFETVGVVQCDGRDEDDDARAALEVPQFVTGIPAALLTHGELRKRRVRVFLSLRDASSTPIDVMRSFLPLAASSSSVLGALERPMSFQSSGPSAGAGSLNVLYTCELHARKVEAFEGHGLRFCSLTMDNQAKAAPVRQFSTRFLPNDGIPEYNALLDNHLGKRREFLLGNRHSLELMQQTGVIQRVEAQPDNPNQYVVHIAEKPIHRRKRLPPRSASGPLQLPESQTMPWRQHSATLELRRSNTNASRLNPDGFLDNGNCDDVSAAKKANAATLKGLSRSFSSNTVMSTSCKPVLKSAAANRLALFGSTKCSALLEASNKHRVSSDVSPPDAIEIRSRSRPVSTSKGTALKRLVGSTTVKGTVEHLLESDAAFMTQIRTMKEQLADLVGKKASVDTEIGRLRRKLRGVNAVRENDVAVAHCSSIMQHRLSKAEEEFMKLVTQQQEVKKDVDRVRRELLSMRKVRQKLQEDIEDVAQANQSYEEKIYASKIVRNQLSEELSELERSAEVELEAQRLNLPPKRQWFQAQLRRQMTAFRVLQNSMGFSDLESLEEQFTTTEEQLLSKYKANLALADEVTALEKEISAVNNEKKINRANVRGIAQASEKIERDMQIRIQSVLSSIKCYNELREQRNREHAKLRDIMLRCLDALQIDVRGSELPDANGNNGSAKATLDRRLIGPKHRLRSFWKCYSGR
ncbi:ODA1/DCC2 family [Phytophthora cactorum]|nr:ODA1/DCC2 family [Phytophthora cactorum]